MKRMTAILVLALALIVAMVGCQNKQPGPDNETQILIDELRTQLKENQKELENANSRIKELENELAKEDKQLDDSAKQPDSIDESKANSQASSSSPNTATPDPKSMAIIEIGNNGQKNIAQSSSFKAGANQVLTLEIKSSIKGGSVDFFLFSPSNQEQRITLGGSDETKIINLTEGTWAYNCTGFFESGDITITGTVQ